jgi:hypothetical protein
MEQKFLSALYCDLQRHAAFERYAAALATGKFQRDTEIPDPRQSVGRGAQLACRVHAGPDNCDFPDAINVHAECCRKRRHTVKIPVNFSASATAHESMNLHRVTSQLSRRQMQRHRLCSRMRQDRSSQPDGDNGFNVAVAAALEVSNAQAKASLRRLVGGETY